MISDDGKLGEPAVVLAAEALPDGTVIDHRPPHKRPRAKPLTRTWRPETFAEMAQEGRHDPVHDPERDGDGTRRFGPPVRKPRKAKLDDATKAEAPKRKRGSKAKETPPAEEAAEQPAVEEKKAKPVRKDKATGGKKPVRKKIDPLRKDTAFVVVPTGVLSHLALMAGVEMTAVMEEIVIVRNVMSTLQRIKFDAAVETEAAPIWVLISMVWRCKQRKLACLLADAQIRAEADWHKGKAACVRWASLLGAELVHPLESGDFERPEEIAYRLIGIAIEQGRTDVKDMETDFKRCRLDPQPAEFLFVDMDEELTPEAKAVTPEPTHDPKPVEATETEPEATDTAQETEPEAAAGEATVEESGTEAEADTEPAPTEEAAEPAADPEPVQPAPKQPAPAPPRSPKAIAAEQKAAEREAKAAELACVSVEQLRAMSPNTRNHWLRRAQQELNPKLVVKPAPNRPAAPQKHVGFTALEKLKALAPK